MAREKEEGVVVPAPVRQEGETGSKDGFYDLELERPLEGSALSSRPREKKRKGGAWYFSEEGGKKKTP